MTTDDKSLPLGSVLPDNRLSLEARAIYAYLRTCMPDGRGSAQTILDDLGISKKRFYKYRHELEAFGLVATELIPTSNGLETVYTFSNNPVPTPEAASIFVNRLESKENRSKSLARRKEQLA